MPNEHWMESHLDDGRPLGSSFPKMLTRLNTEDRESLQPSALIKRNRGARCNERVWGRSDATIHTEGQLTDTCDWRLKHLSEDITVCADGSYKLTNSPSNRIKPREWQRMV